MLLDRPFVLLCGVNIRNAIQAQQGGGLGLTLQPFDNSFQTPTQQFVLRMQNNVDNNGNVVGTGAAFVNLGKFDGLHGSVTGLSNNQPLVMEPYDPYNPSSLAQNAWTIEEAIANELTGISIFATGGSNQGSSWNDWNGRGTVGDPIYLYKGQAANSVWIVQLVPVKQSQQSEKSGGQEVREPVHTR